MQTEALSWIVALAIPPATVIAAYGLGLRGRRLYALATACACLLALLAAAPLAATLLPISPWLQKQIDPLQSPQAHPLGPMPLVLVPFASMLWLLTVLVTPSSRLDEKSLTRTAAVCMLIIGSFLTTSPWMLLLFWMGTVLIYIAGHAEPRFNRVRRVATITMVLSTTLLAAGIALSTWYRGRGGVAEQIGIGLILLAALVRMGIFPFHAWIPEIFDHGRIGPANMFCAPQLGTYVALVLAVPHASAALMGTAAVLGLVTALYGALMALYQTDARRACGYLFVSQSALVIAGMEMGRREALVGALILWVSSGLALAALSRCVLVLEARRGRLSLTRFHGGYERMPILATCFLILSLAMTGFPATLGFVGGEMLVRGAVDSFPGLGLSIVVAGALNGLAVMRIYFSLFCGRRDTGVHLDFLRSELFGFGLAALLLLGFGLAPGGLIRILDIAGATAIERREGSHSAKPSTAQGNVPLWNRIKNVAHS